jgi:OCT family organic cation transporter-like MFS transporter 4/5
MPICDINDTFTYSDWPEEQMFPSLDPNNKDFDDENPNYCTYYMPKSLDAGECVFDKNQTGTCTGDVKYAYEKFEMDSSVDTENDLVCKDGYIWIPMIDTFMMIGLLIGSFVFGVLSDKIGRRHTLLLAILCACTGNLIGSFMPNQWSYGIAR